MFFNFCHIRPSNQSFIRYLSKDFFRIREIWQDFLCIVWECGRFCFRFNPEKGVGGRISRSALLKKSWYLRNFRSKMCQPKELSLSSKLFHTGQNLSSKLRITSKMRIEALMDKWTAYKYIVTWKVWPGQGRKMAQQKKREQWMTGGKEAGRREKKEKKLHLGRNWRRSKMTRKKKRQVAAWLASLLAGNSIP